MRRIWSQMWGVGREESGQASLFLALVSLVLAFFLIFELNSLANVTDRIEAQNAVDAAAIAEADWIARGMNVEAMANIAMAMTVAEIMMVEAVYHTTVQGSQILIIEGILTIFPLTSSLVSHVFPSGAWDWIQLVWDLNFILLDEPYELGGGGSKYKQLRDALWWSVRDLTAFQDCIVVSIPGAGAAWCHLVGSANGLQAAAIAPVTGMPLAEGEVVDLCRTVFDGNLGGYSWTPDLIGKFDFFVGALVSSLIDAVVPDADFSEIVWDAAYGAASGPLGPASGLAGMLSGVLFDAIGLSALESFMGDLASLNPNEEMHEFANGVDWAGALESLFGGAENIPGVLGDEWELEVGPLWSIEQLFPLLFRLTADHLKWLAPVLWIVAILDTYNGYCDQDGEYSSPFRYLTAFTIFMIGLGIGFLCGGWGILIGGVIGAVVGVLFVVANVDQMSLWDILLRAVFPMAGDFEEEYDESVGNVLTSIFDWLAGAVNFILEDVLEETIRWVLTDIIGVPHELVTFFFEQPLYSTYLYRTEEGMALATPRILRSGADVQSGRVAMGMRREGAGVGRLAGNLFRPSGSRALRTNPLLSGRLVLAEAEVYNATLVDGQGGDYGLLWGSAERTNSAAVEAMFVPQWRVRLRPCTTPSQNPSSLEGFSSQAYNALYSGIDNSDLQWFERATQRITEAPPDALDYMLAH